MSSARLEQAEAFLREAVYRSRERQAAAAALEAPKSSKGGKCGLGEKAAVDLDLTQRAREISAKLWPDGLDDASLERVRRVMSEWVVAQDAIDRKRNHHMKAVRLKHGFDRDKYPPHVAREFEAGLDRVNVEENESRRSAAHDLLGN